MSSWPGFEFASRPGAERLLNDTDKAQTKVAIIGAGLAGLYAGTLLHSAGIDFKLIEARERLGGRILSANESGTISEDGFDLGASWFWPHIQPQLAAVVQKLGLSSFAQHNDGDVIFERMSRETPWRYRATQQEPQSMRLAGGTGALVRALAERLPQASLHLDACVTKMVLGRVSVRVTITNSRAGEYALDAGQVIAALPPRLVAKVSFEPPIPSTIFHRWRETATWMAPHAKFFAVYDRPFWRDARLSGTAQSLVGPLAEIHDATTASGKAALLGFVGVSADQRASLGEERLAKACIQQLARLYGPEAGRPRSTIVKDWATDPHTATAEDRAGGGHPTPLNESWVTGAWQDRLSLGGSETSDTEPGFLAGAIAAAERAVSEVIKRLGASD